MTRTALGDLEHQVLIATLRLRGEAYSVSVVLEIEARTGREVAQSAVFIAMRRLEAKGLLQSRLDEQTGEKGRVRRYFDLTPAGMEKLREMRRALLNLWDGFAAELEGAR
ncbi:MAG: PadR family transcriptional regulator [Planctomycetota bacterium]